MNILVTYDLPTLHTEVKQAAIRAGFTDLIYAIDGSLNRLPNTTLLVEAASTDDARAKFVNVVASVSPFLTIEKLIAVDWHYASIISNDTKVQSFLSRAFAS